MFFDEHQIEKCKQLSKQMGFEEFRVKRPSRFTVYDTQGNVEPEAVYFQLLQC